MMTTSSRMEEMWSNLAMVKDEDRVVVDLVTVLEGMFIHCYRRKRRFKLLYRSGIFLCVY
jgi:hypothetical protein